MKFLSRRYLLLTRHYKRNISKITFESVNRLNIVYIFDIVLLTPSRITSKEN
jgi:hypothetical protein